MRIICHLDRLLTERNMDVRQLHLASGVREMTLGEMRRDENKSFSRKNIVAIMKALDLTDITQLISMDLEIEEDL